MPPEGCGFRNHWRRTEMMGWRRYDAPLDCRQVARIIQRHIDGELDEHAARAVARHLEVCLRCGLDARTYHELKRRLVHLQEPVDAATIERLRRFVSRLAADL
jgi:anti-sigma factor RsiW